MKTITIKITGKVSHGRENLQVLIVFSTPLISQSTGSGHGTIYRIGRTDGVIPLYTPEGVLSNW